MLNYNLITFAAFHADNFSHEFIKDLYTSNIPAAWEDKEDTLKEHIFSIGCIQDALSEEENKNNVMHGHSDMLAQIREVLEPLQTEYFRIDDIPVEIIAELN